MHDINDNLKSLAKLDAKIINLINERAEVEVRLFKDDYLKGRKNYLDRLVETGRSIKNNLSGPLSEDALRSIFREIVSATLPLVKPLAAAYLGPPATFAHMACMRAFGSSVNSLPVGSIARVFEEVEKGRADYGVVPVENSTEGTVTYTVDMFVDSNLKICGEVLLQISQNLLSRSRSLQEIKKVYSHPQALAQCRFWLENNIKGAELVPVDSTARAAEYASKEPQAAAVASEAAATIYDLHIVEPSIQDQCDNYTRFFVIGNQQVSCTGRDKTSILFSVKHEAGALYRALKVFADHGLSMTQIESRPSKKKAWEYVFFVDFEGHMEQENVSNALKELEPSCLFVKILGSYPRSE